MSSNSHADFTLEQLDAMRAELQKGLAAEQEQEAIRAIEQEKQKEAAAKRRKEAAEKRRAAKKAAQSPSENPETEPVTPSNPADVVPDAVPGDAPSAPSAPTADANVDAGTDADTNADVGDESTSGQSTPDKPTTPDASPETPPAPADESQSPPASPPAPKKPLIYSPSSDALLDYVRDRDKGAGVLFSLLFSDRFVYVPEYGAWYRYSGSHWVDATTHELDAAVERVVDKYKELQIHLKMQLNDARDLEDKEKIEILEKCLEMTKCQINSLHSPSGVSGCLRFALGNDHPLTIPSNKLDNNSMQLCCQNGLVDLRTGAFRECKPRDYVTQTSPYDWVSMDAPAPIFRKMVYEILGEDEAVARYFQKIIGYAFAGRITEKILVVMYGEDGDSGKTTLFEILKKITSQASSMPVELLLDSGQALNPNNPTPALMALKGQRLMWASEPGEGRKFSVDRVKLLTGGDSLKARSPWDKAATEFDPTHTLFLLTNHKMRAGANDQAFWSRIKLLDCPFSFVAKPDPNNPKQRQRREGLQDEILANEGAGVLAYIVEGYQLYAAEGLEPPEKIVEETRKYRREEDLVAEFYETCLEPAADNNIQATQLYEVFKKWFEDYYSKRVPSLTTFGKLAQRHLKKERIGGKIFYINIGLQPDASYKYGPK